MHLKGSFRTNYAIKQSTYHERRKFTSNRAWSRNCVFNSLLTESTNKRRPGPTTTFTSVNITNLGSNLWKQMVARAPICMYHNVLLQQLSCHIISYNLYIVRLHTCIKLTSVAFVSLSSTCMLLLLFPIPLLKYKMNTCSLCPVIPN